MIGIPFSLYYNNNKIIIFYFHTGGRVPCHNSRGWPRWSKTNTIYNVEQWCTQDFFNLEERGLAKYTKLKLHFGF